MKAEEKKLSSIPQAIGLFMIFKALFYRNAYEGLTFPDTFFNHFIQFSESTGFYLFLIVGIGLCLYKKFIFYYLAYFSCAFTLFGSIYVLAPGKYNLPMLISFVLAHILLCAVLIWSQVMIKRILGKQKELIENT
jgi:hypothetical protein